MALLTKDSFTQKISFPGEKLPPCFLEAALFSGCRELSLKLRAAPASRTGAPRALLELLQSPSTPEGRGALCKLTVTRASWHKGGNFSGDTVSIYQHGCSSLPVGYFTFCFCLLLGPAAAALQRGSCREVLPATAAPKARAAGAAASSSPWQPLGHLCTGQGRSYLNLASAFRWVNFPDAHLYPPSCQAAPRELGPFIFSLITDFSSISSWVNTNVAERLASCNKAFF